MKVKSAPMAVIMAVAMLAATYAAHALRPTHRLGAADQQPRLEKVVPLAFGQWEIDRSVDPIPASPDLERRLDLYYDQVLSRTYLNKATGEQIMLSIAHGGEQSRTAQVHRPEVCYASQGFMVAGLRKDALRIAGQADLPVMRLIGTLGSRTEPVTYWVRFGNDVVRGNLEQGVSRLSHGLRGDIPDALLFRVSTISGNVEQAYPVHDRFVGELIASIDANTRRFLLAQY